MGRGVKEVGAIPLVELIVVLGHWMSAFVVGV
jgi:hypothetical protein